VTRELAARTQDLVIESGQSASFTLVFPAPPGEPATGYDVEVAAFERENPEGTWRRLVYRRDYPLP
jgi:hypothetical protein